MSKNGRPNIFTCWRGCSGHHRSCGAAQRRPARRRRGRYRADLNSLRSSAGCFACKYSQSEGFPVHLARLVCGPGAVRSGISILGREMGLSVGAGITARRRRARAPGRLRCPAARRASRRRPPCRFPMAGRAKSARRQ